MSISMVRTGGGLGLLMVGRGVKHNLSMALFLLSDVARSSSICVNHFVGEDVLSAKVCLCLKAQYGSLYSVWVSVPQPEVGGVEKVGVLGSLGGNGVSSALWVALIYALVLVLPCFIVSVG